MARAIHWQIPFVSRLGTQYYVNIYEDDYTGSVVTLKGAATPFETEVDNDEDMLMPIRTQSGYIKVIDEGNLDGLLPTNAMKRYVTLTSVDSVLWHGFMQCQEFSRTLWEGVQSVEYAVDSCIAILNKIEMPQTTGFVTLNSLVSECLAACNCDFDNIIWPKEITISEVSDDYTSFWNIKVMKTNFFQDADLKADDPEYKLYELPAYMDVLTSIVEFFGWTLVEHGRDIWFVSRNTTTYLSCAWSSFKAGYYTSEETTCSTSGLDSLTTASNDHEESVIDGYRQVKISADVNSKDNLIELPDDNKLLTRWPLPAIGYENFQYNGDHTSGPWHWYSRSYSTGKVPTLRTYGYQMYAYDSDGDGVDDAVDVSNYYGALQDPVEGHAGYAIGRMINGDFCLQSDITKEDNPKTDWDMNFRMYLKCFYPDGNPERVRPTDAQIKAMPLFTIFTDYDILFYNGAIAIEVDYEDIGNGNTNGILAKLRIGNWYWDGSYWTLTESYFTFNPQDNQKTISMPYSGARGTICPIGFDYIYGTISFTVYPSTGFNEIWRSVNLRYYPTGDIFNEDKTENTYYQQTGYASSEKKEIELEICTDNDNRHGLALLYYGYSYLESLFYMGTQKRPEEALLDTMAKVYGKSTKKLRIEAEYVDINPGQRFTYEGQEYVVISTSYDWRDSSMNLTVEDIAS